MPKSDTQWGLVARVTPYWKALVGFVAPGAVLIVAEHGDLSGHDWLVVAASCFVTGGAVYVSPKNKPKG
jgi:hypothetical protein